MGFTVFTLDFRLPLPHSEREREGGEGKKNPIKTCKKSAKNYFLITSKPLDAALGLN